MIAATILIVIGLGGLHARLSRGARSGRASARFHRALDVLGDMAAGEHNGPPPPDAGQPTPPPHGADRGDDATGPNRLVFTDASLTGPADCVAPGRRARVPAGRRPPGHRSRRALLVAVPLAVAGVVVGVVASLPGASPRPAAHVARPPAPTSTAPPAPTSTAPPAPTSTAPAPTTAAPSAPATTVAAASSRPVVAAISPAAGRVGDTFTVRGSGFMSADGRIVARVGGRVATTRCPVPERCTVIVPPGASGPVPVVITTDGGVSAPVTFDIR